ncbi:hypothetical protein GCM10009665_20620 [Kitasatospora nipponensis]|uniref:SAF domain-containing protein n=1 Tax=Kitasatospora nipponensis TaxID=258049 RepID=A0ABN1W0S5_9ACTN
MENRTFPSPALGSTAPATGYGLDQSATDTAGVAARAGGRPVPVAPSRSLRARRRRPAVIAMAAALIAAGGLGGAILYNSTGQRIEVLALARDVPYGQTLTAQDLVVARIAGDPALAPVNAADHDLAVGQRATTDLHRGALLLVADLTRALVVQPGQQEVGLPVRRNQLPAEGVQVGQKIVIVQVGGDPTAAGGHGPVVMNAIVSRLGRAEGDGGQVINVAVPQSDAAVLALWAADGKYQVITAPKAGAAADGSPATPSPGASGAAGASGAPSPGAGAGASGVPSSAASGTHPSGGA